MKVLLVFSLCIVAASIVQSMPLDSNTAELQEFQAIIENALKKSLENEVLANNEDEEKEDVMSAELQEFLASQQSTSAEAQGFFKNLWKGAKKFVKKAFKHGKKAYNIWKKVKGVVGCEQNADMPEELEDAVAEAFLVQHQNSLLQSLEGEVVANGNDQVDEMSAELQEFLAAQQDMPVELQGFFKKLWKKVKKVAKKTIKFGKKAYGIWNKIKGGVACEQNADMPEELEDAVAEAFIKQEQNVLSFAALELLIE